jgi:hypothetical protein
MFHGTSFTESTQSQLTLERLLSTSLQFWERFPKSTTHEGVSQAAVAMADRGLMERFGVSRNLDFEGVSTGHIAAWMLNAAAVQWFGLWGDLAFPRVQMSHSFAAQLMATTISQKEIPNVEAPWPAFVLEVPHGLLPLPLANGTTTHIERIHVVSHFLPSHFPSPRWWSFWITGQGVEIIRAGVLEEAVVARGKREIADRPLSRIDGPRPAGEPRDIPIENDEAFWEGYAAEHEERLSVLIGRLVIGACVFMTERANYQERTAKMGRSLAPHAQRVGKKPESRVYIVGKPVKVDFRLAVKAYLEGTRGPLTVQSLIAGHHKMQPHGPGSVERKWIYVSPYWRGPEDGPILVRPHVGGEP